MPHDDQDAPRTGSSPGFRYCTCDRPPADFEDTERDASVDAFQKKIAECPPQGWCMMKKLAMDFEHSLKRADDSAPKTICGHCNEMRPRCGRYRRIRRVEPARLYEPEFLRDAKIFLSQSGLSTPDLLRLLPLWLEQAGCVLFVDRRRQPVVIDLDPLQEAGIDWLAEWRVPPLPHIVPLVHEIAIPRIWPMLTILRMRYPNQTRHWGKRPIG